MAGPLKNFLKQLKVAAMNFFSPSIVPSPAPVLIPAPAPTPSPVQIQASSSRAPAPSPSPVPIQAPARALTPVSASSPAPAPTPSPVPIQAPARALTPVSAPTPAPTTTTTTSPSHQNVPVIMVPVLLVYLQLKYQGTPKSPFQTHPISIFVSIGSLILYYGAYYAELRWPMIASVASRLMVVFGSLSLVSTAAILIPDSFGPLLYFSYSLFFAIEFLNLLIWACGPIVSIFFTTKPVPSSGDDLV